MYVNGHGIIPALDARAVAERATWQYRAIEVTRGNQTKLGTMLLAIIGRNAKHPPILGPEAAITQEGTLFANYQAKDGTFHAHQILGRIQDAVDAFRRLADAIKATDAEREAMFSEFRKWIVRDFRAKSDANFF